MLDEATQSQLNSLITNAQSICILFPTTASLDQQAAALALSSSLTAAGKTVRTVTPEQGEQQETALLGAEQITSDLGNQNLSISFPYSPDQVDKVSYHIGQDTNMFYLTIKPKVGQAPLDASTVAFSYTGAAADLLVVVGVSDLEQLEQLYFGYEDLYRDAPIISIASHTTTFGTVKIDTGSLSSTSEAVATLIQSLQLSIDSDAATNLLAGVESATARLTALSTTAETFEVVAFLLRAGARRKYQRVPRENGIATQPNGYAAVHTQQATQHQTQETDLIAETQPAVLMKPKVTEKKGNTPKKPKAVLPTADTLQQYRKL